MEKTLLLWLKGRSRVALADIRKELGKTAMDLFMVNYKKWRYSFCMECNFYVHNRVFDALNDMCLDCKKIIKKWEKKEEDEPEIEEEIEEEGLFNEFSRDEDDF
jgi:hypothetical protein